MIYFWFTLIPPAHQWSHLKIHDVCEAPNSDFVPHQICETTESSYQLLTLTPSTGELVSPLKGKMSHNVCVCLFSVRSWTLKS